MAIQIEFTEDLLLNIDMVDRDHRELYSLTNELFLAVDSGKVAVGFVLGRLWQFTKEHFTREEELMLSCNYGGLDAHKKEHEHMLFQIEELTGRILNLDHPVIDHDVSEFLISWLRIHIRRFDKFYVDYTINA
jgi:hemerythrin-like metal-binding protein